MSPSDREKYEKLIDDHMKEKYGAIRSVVTSGRWVETSPTVLVCAYVHLPEDKSKNPNLYMVHWAWSLSGGNGKPAVLVYTFTERL